MRSRVSPQCRVIPATQLSTPEEDKASPLDGQIERGFVEHPPPPPAPKQTVTVTANPTQHTMSFSGPTA